MVRLYSDSSARNSARNSAEISGSPCSQMKNFDIHIELKNAKHIKLELFNN